MASRSMRLAAAPALRRLAWAPPQPVPAAALPLMFCPPGAGFGTRGASAPGLLLLAWHFGPRQGKGQRGFRRCRSRRAASLVGAGRRPQGRGHPRCRKREPVLVRAPDMIVQPRTVADNDGLARVESGLWRDIQHVYCLNLDRRPERWSFMRRQFDRLQMTVQRWSAVDGQVLDLLELSRLGLVAKEALVRFCLPEEQKLFGTDITLGSMGRALSHMQIWRDVVLRVAGGCAEERTAFLVVEDDCQFMDGFCPGLLRERLQHVPADWEMVYLGGQDLLHRQDCYTVGPGVRRLYRGFRETTAYLVNAVGAKAALEACVPIFWQLDTHLCDESLRRGLRAPEENEPECTLRPRGYCLWPPVAFQWRDGFPSDVQKSVR